MLDGSLGERDGPLWVVVTDGSRDRESAWQLRVDGDLLAGIELGDEVAFDLGVRDDVLVNVLLQLFAGTGEILLGLILGEDRRVRSADARGRRRLRGPGSTA